MALLETTLADGIVGFKITVGQHEREAFEARMRTDPTCGQYEILEMDLSGKKGQLVFLYYLYGPSE